MVADSNHPSIPARRLAERLRALREGEYKQLTQKQLAKVLGGVEALSIATVSLWEKPGSNRLPPPQRLATYARLFCTSRSFEAGAPRLLRDDELTEQEQEREADLYAELLALRERAQSAGSVTPSSEQSALEHPSSIWRFPDGMPVTIVCSDAPKGTRPPYAQPTDLNYTPYARHADLNALTEVHGQIRADNPTSEVRIIPIEEFDANASTHVVVIGGKATDEATNLLSSNLILPEAVTIDCPTGQSYFFRGKGKNQEFRSSFKGETLVEDIGVFARSPHPGDSRLTVTFCNGITSRGVHGVALCFTASELKDRNEQFIKQWLDAETTYCILMRITVLKGTAVRPELSENNTWYYQGPDKAKTGTE